MAVERKQRRSPAVSATEAGAGVPGTCTSEAVAEQASASSTPIASGDLLVRCHNTFLECPPPVDWLDPEDCDELLMLRLGLRRRACSTPPRLCRDRGHDEPASGRSTPRSSQACSTQSDPLSATSQIPKVKKLRLCKSKRERFRKVLGVVLAKAAEDSDNFMLRPEELPRMITENPSIFADLLSYLEESLGRSVAVAPPLA